MVPIIFFFFFEFERSAQNSAGQNNSIINIGIAEIIKKRNRDCQKHKKKNEKSKIIEFRSVNHRTPSYSYPLTPSSPPQRRYSNGVSQLTE